MLRLLPFVLLIAGSAKPDAETPSCYLVRAKKLVTADRENPVFDHGALLIRDGRIAALGREHELEIPDRCAVVDARDFWLVPGFVDCHNHTAASRGDINDMVYGTNPGLRTLETVETETENMRRARRGGVSTVLLIPGSGTNLSGFGTLVKTHGETPEEVVIRSPGSLKIAQGDNPKRYWYRQERSYMAYSLRETLNRARRYHDAWLAHENNSTPKPPFDLTYEAFRGLFEHEFPVSVHTQRYQLVMKSIAMLHDEFDLWTLLDHSTFDGFYAAPLAKARELEVIVGPRQIHWDTENRVIRGCAGEWYERGATAIGINTDAPVVPQEELRTQTAMAIHFGLPQREGIYALTSVPARGLGIADRVGSLEIGKDADFGLWTGDPIDLASGCVALYVNGELAYSEDKDHSLEPPQARISSNW